VGFGRLACGKAEVELGNGNKKFRSNYMLDTLLKIGEWQSQGKGEWDRFLEWPKINAKKNQYTIGIVFDLDRKDISLELKEFDSKNDARNYFNFLTKERRGQSFYVSATPKRLKRCFDAFFGKIEENGAELLKAIEKYNLAETAILLIGILKEIQSLKEVYIQKGTHNGEFEYGNILKQLELDTNSEVALIYFAVKSLAHNITEPKPFVSFQEYLNLTKTIFLNEGIKLENSKKLSYVSGKLKSDVSILNLSDRDNLNAMFVTTTKNYAHNFSDEGFLKNYQVSNEEQKSLDFAAKFLVKNYSTRIANIDHVILPHFRNKEGMDLELMLQGIKKKADLLFNIGELKNLKDDISDETEDIFWINFVAYETDGNSFKSKEIIKDVSNFYFEKVISLFMNIHWEYKEAKFVDWSNVMTEFGKSGKFFNFNTIYSLIPVRKDKEKKNRALDLLKTILENRRVDQNKLFDYFRDLILCHYYERYASYTNVPKSSKDYFRKTVRDSVFKYLAFIEVLKKLKVINMEEKLTSPTDDQGNKYNQAIQSFFSRMQLNSDQQAMFYLGRILNAVEWIQVQKKIKKTVINKINFNGIEKSDIERLRKDLIDKARQHGQISKVIFNDRKFSELFDYNKWNKTPMDPNEALFFLLTGYSFGTSTKEVDELNQVEFESQETSNQ
jgi:CRISPR-associated protein Csh1